MEGPEDKDTVKWDDGTHEIYTYDDDTGRGLTRCGIAIGPWDAWLVGQVTCVKCRCKAAEENYPIKGPLDWFPKISEPVCRQQ